jgi:two-component system catabolic regulation response regulator CreB
MPRSILIVEDEENVSELLAFAFRRAGYEPIVLRDGRAAVEHVLSSEPASAVLLDVMLPCRDGFAVAEVIRGDERWGAVPVVMLSARAGEADVMRARAVGADEYVAKPFSPRSLVECVQGHVDKARG